MKPGVTFHPSTADLVYDSQEGTAGPAPVTSHSLGPHQLVTPAFSLPRKGAVLPQSLCTAVSTDTSPEPVCLTPIPCLLICYTLLAFLVYLSSP